MWDKVRSRVDRVRMPEPGIKPIVYDDFGDVNIMLLAVFQKPLPGEDHVQDANRYTPRDLDIFSQRLADDIKLITSVAKVARTGVQDEVIYLETDMGAWSRLAISTTKLRALLEQRNIVAPGGSIETGVGRYTVKPSGDIDAVRELGSLVIGTIGEGKSRTPIYLEDLGLEVIRDYRDPPHAISRYGDAFGSKPCVIVAFSMKKGANIVSVCDEAKKTVDRLTHQQKILPPDIGVAIVSDQSETVDRKIKDFLLNVLGAVLIVVAVVYLMVGFRPAFVMAANIPLVIVGSLALITLFGVQLEQISLAAMIIALGMLVDNAVQICDQTRRLQMEGMTRLDAAREGANQLAFPVLIATGTTIAAFYPMLIGLQGSMNEYVRSLPITLTVTLGLSYLLAMTFCVLLAYWMIKPPKDPNTPSSPVVALVVWAMALLPRKSQRERVEKNDQFERREGLMASLYMNMARAAIKLRWLVIVVSFGLLGLSMLLPIANEFFPKDLRDQFAVEVWMPEGSTIEQTNSAAKQVERILQATSPFVDEAGNPKQRLRAMCTVVGKGCDRWYLGRGPESPKANYAEIVVRTTSGVLTPDYADDIRRIAREGDAGKGLKPVVGARVIPRELLMGPAVDAPIGLRLFGPRLGTGFADYDVMRGKADELKKLLQDAHGTWDVYDSWGSSSLQLDVDVDVDAANLAGVTNATLAQSLNAYYSGHHLTTFREGDHLVPVYLRLPPQQRGSIERLSSAYVEGVRGKVPLNAVANLETRWVPSRIDRRFLQRVIEIRARVEPGFQANDIVVSLINSADFNEWKTNLPPGYWWEVGGALFESQFARADLAVALVISVLCIILLLIIQYNGVAKPFIILTTLPLALIGALGGLYIMDKPLGFMPQLGVLSLFGIVVNTAIIYIEFAERLIKESSQQSNGSGPIAGLSVAEFRECLVRAGQVRLLPIAMTTLTTIGGLLPLALAGGPLWEGMAWLMIFGLIVATFLTLIVVPSLYSIFVEHLKMSPLPRSA